MRLNCQCVNWEGNSIIICIVNSCPFVRNKRNASMNTLRAPHHSFPVDKFLVTLYIDRDRERESDMIIDHEINRFIIEQSINTSLNDSCLSFRYSPFRLCQCFNPLECMRQIYILTDFCSLTIWQQISTTICLSMSLIDQKWKYFLNSDLSIFLQSTLEHWR